VPFGDGRLVLSPTDLVGHLACPHLTTLEHAVVAPIRTLGDAHEQSVVDEMRSLLDVVETHDPTIFRPPSSCAWGHLTGGSGFLQSSIRRGDR
jgi:hypothetical protein